MQQDVIGPAGVESDVHLLSELLGLLLGLPHRACTVNSLCPQGIQNTGVELLSQTQPTPEASSCRLSPFTNSSPHQSLQHEHDYLTVSVTHGSWNSKQDDGD